MSYSGDMATAQPAGDMRLSPAPQQLQAQLATTLPNLPELRSDI